MYVCIFMIVVDNYSDEFLVIHWLLHRLMSDIYSYIKIIY